MKELTIEEKAQRYDEALNITKNLINAGLIYEDAAVQIFPELVESEDERIKKALSDILLIDSDEIREILDSNNLLMQDIDSWLKNQGKQKSIDDLTQQEAMDIAVAKCFDEQKSDDLRTTGYWRVEDIEQNYSVNKVEPKFHEGEWITNGDYTWKIVEVKPLDYILQSQNGNIVDDTISHVDEQFHAFTIEDARDGDVLALNDKTIVIFKDLYSSTTFHAYCYVKEDTFNVSQDDIPDWWNSEGFYPATKEQSDNLMKAMTDAGWEFDLDKKELKKIEQKPIEWHREDEQNLNACLGYIPDEYLRRWLTDTIHVKYDNPAWSEEDENMLKLVIKSCEQCGNEYAYYWLKSLKDRVQPKQESLKSITANCDYSEYEDWT